LENNNPLTEILLNDYMQESRKEQQQWAKKNNLAIDAVKAKLFKIAGSRISPQPYEFITVLAEYGQQIDLAVKFRPMERNSCHYNVSLLWQQRSERSRLRAIATGYALSEDGMWRPHSWGLTRTYILETTIERCEYFGIVMHGEAADIFVAGHMLETTAPEHR
jgi:hypothetical protein